MILYFLLYKYAMLEVPLFMHILMYPQEKGGVKRWG